MPFLVIFAAMAACVGWIWGEWNDKPWIRRTCGPAFTLILVVVVSIFVGIDTSFDSSLIYSGAVKDFVSALVAAIERGDTDAAHQELRQFDTESIQTYEEEHF